MALYVVVADKDVVVDGVPFTFRGGQVISDSVYDVIKLQLEGVAMVDVFDNQITLDRARFRGVKVEFSSPTFPWHDMLGEIRPKAIGVGSPTLGAFRGGNYNAFSFLANDVIDLEFHIPHDYAMGSDVFLHAHWAHNGTSISGSFVIDYYVTYAKGHQQAAFPVEVTLTQTIATPNVATVPQYQHRIDEVQLSASNPSASQIDTDDLEPDGLVLIRAKAITIPVIGGGSPNRPFILFIDLHYQSTGIGTKEKAPDFWT